jgi:hypothetical protein
MGEYVRITEDVTIITTNGNRYVGEGVHEVASDDVDEVLSGNRSDITQPADGPEDDASGGTQGDSEASEGSGDSDSDSETTETEGEESEGLNATEFVDRQWQRVRSDIGDGAADGHLAAVEDAENDRDNPRDSILEAIDNRR